MKKILMPIFLSFPIFLSMVFFQDIHAADPGIELAGQITVPVPKNTSYKYIVDGGGLGSVKMCSVSPATGALSGCIPTGSGFTNPSDISFDSSTGPNLAYIPSVNGFNTITICTVSATTGAFSNCTSVTAGNISWPSSLTVVNGFGYIANFIGTNDVSKCQLAAPSTYITSPCTPFATGAVNPSDLKSYNSKIYSVSAIALRMCDVSSPSPVCQNASSYGFSNPVAMTISNGFAYVLNSGTNTIIKCSIQPNGTLSSCAPLSPAGPAFNFGCCSFVGVAANNSYAYISNGSDNTVRVCTVNPDNTFGTCSKTGSGPINTPRHIY